jgi:hypothetical protein
MLTRRRRLVLHAMFAVWMPLFACLLFMLSPGGTKGLLLVAAAGASIVVGVGFAIRFFTLLSKPDQSTPAESPPAGGTVRHWTEKALMAWTGLCIAALTAEAVRAGLHDSDRMISVVGYLLIMALMTMQSVRLVRAEHASKTL